MLPLIQVLAVGLLTVVGMGLEGSQLGSLLGRRLEANTAVGVAADREAAVAAGPGQAKQSQRLPRLQQDRARVRAAAWRLTTRPMARLERSKTCRQTTAVSVAV